MGLRDLAAVLTTREARSSDAGLFGHMAGWSADRSDPIGYDRAQAHHAVYGCVDLLTRIVAWQMPAFSGDALATAGIVTSPQPDPQLSAQHWRAQALESAMLRGYACGLVTSTSAAGWPAKIQPLHPDLLSWWDDRGRWRWRADGRDVELWQLGGNLWVAPSPRVTPGQPVGRSVLAHAADKVRLGLNATKFGSDFFRAGGMPVAHVKVLDRPDLTQAQAGLLKRRVIEATRNREPLASGNNVELTSLKVTAEESQFLQTIAANAAQVCMFFGVPPESIGASSGDSMTYANVEGRNLALLTNTVGAWMQWFEWLFSSLLPGRQSVTLDPEALLRTSVPTLFNTAQVGYTSGLLSQDEGRAMLGYGPAGEGKFKEPASPGTATNGGGGTDAQPSATP